LVVEAELFIDFDEVNGDEDFRTAYPCPFCAEDFDLLELCCHIDLDHPTEAKSGVFYLSFTLIYSPWYLCMRTFSIPLPCC